MAETSFIQFPSGRLRKRPKIERDSDDTILPDLPLLEIDRPLWLADGNVVIIAQSQTAFRVHKSVLLRHSDAFKTLLAVAEPTFGETSKVEGCPVVHTEDTAHDFKHLLHALYDGLDTCLKPDEPAAFSTLAALARLGYKYSIDRIFTAAIKRLKAVFTDDFQAWRAHEGRTTPLVKFTRNDAIEAVNLFRKCNQARLLPSALYMCCSLSVHTLLHGAQRADGTVEKLALNDLERCLVAQQKIEARSTAFNHRVLDFSDPARPACVARDSPTCSTRLPQLLRGLGDAVGALGGDAGASTRQQCLRVFVETHRSPEMRETLGLCRICAEYVLSSDLLFSEELWHDLPSVLDLPVSEWH